MLNNGQLRRPLPPSQSEYRTWAAMPLPKLVKENE
jgi:hypothetical protein